MRDRRALPMNPLMLAASSRNSPAATRSRVDILVRMSGRGLHRARHAGHPIGHHVAGQSSVDPDKAGRRHAHYSPSPANHCDRSEAHMS